MTACEFSTHVVSFFIADLGVYGKILQNLNRKNIIILSSRQLSS